MLEARYFVPFIPNTKQSPYRIKHSCSPPSGLIAASTDWQIKTTRRLFATVRWISTVAIAYISYNLEFAATTQSRGVVKVV